MKLLSDYGSFLLEKLILESNVIYSDIFRKVLLKMPENQIAKQLLEIENKDLDVLSNYFDLKKDNENVITFTLDKIAQEIIKGKKDLVNYFGPGGCMTNNIEANTKIFNILGYTPKVDKGPVYHPRNDESGEIVSKTTSEKTGKTWCYVKFPNGEGVYDETKLRKENIDLNKSIFDKSRQEIRIGRGIRLLLSANSITVNDAEIEKFVNDFRATVRIMNDIFSNFEIVDGEKLLYWYHRNNYLEPNSGSLGSSCQAVGRRDWLEIYIKNPVTVKLVILKSPDRPDKILGRALLWNLEDGSKMMDYIYVSRDSDYKIFQDYAKHNGWKQRDEDWTETFVARLETRREFAKYPSVDTMRQWDPETGTISNNSFPGSTEIIWTEDDDYDEDDRFEDEDIDEDDN
jgi:hypothetical protein